MTSPETHRSDTLYVVLHGLISIVETPTDLQLFLIDMGSDHEYQGGTWGDWSDMPQGATATLTGVKDGGVGIDPIANPVVKVSSLPVVSTPGVYGVITVPKPRKLYSLDQGKIQIASGSDNLVQTPDTLSGVRVLEYEVQESLDNLSVSFPGHGEFWTAGPSITRLHESQRFAVLHISDGPPIDSLPSADHNVNEFAQSSQVLGAEIQIDQAVIVLNAPDSAMPLGLSRFELGLEIPRPGDQNQHGGGCRACCGGVDGKVVPGR